MLLPTTGILIADNITGHTIYRIMGLNKCKSVSNFNQKNRVMVMDYFKKKPVQSLLFLRQGRILQMIERDFLMSPVNGLIMFLSFLNLRNVNLRTLFVKKTS